MSKTEQAPRQHWDDPLRLIDTEVKRHFDEEGVVLLRGALHPQWLLLIEMGLGRVLADAAVTKHEFFAGTEGAFRETVRNFDVAPEIRRLMFDSPIADLLGAAMGSEQVFYYSDEFFIKDRGGCERTPWHQDTPYFPLAGKQIASIWISLDRLPREECLEFIPGSHRQTLYDGFDPADPGNPKRGFYGEGLPQRPDIEADRSAWNIVGWDIEPGDVIISSPSILHGGGPTRVDGRRRALAIRCFGGDAVFAERPDSRPTVPLTPGLGLHLRPGDPLRSPWYPRLRPVPPWEQYG